MKFVAGEAHGMILSVVACLAFLLLVTPCAFSSEAESVILLHGYGRTTFSMRPLQKRLEEAGFMVHNIGYPSMRRSPAELVEILDDQLE
ncbi:MAG: esterase/lipase family protein, partial [Desulfuromonadales bacterium]